MNANENRVPRIEIESINYLDNLIELNFVNRGGKGELRHISNVNQGEIELLSFNSKRFYGTVNCPLPNGKRFKLHIDIKNYRKNIVDMGVGFKVFDTHGYTFFQFLEYDEGIVCSEPVVARK